MIFLERASMRPTACSATASLLAPDWLQNQDAGFGTGIDVNHVIAGA